MELLTLLWGTVLLRPYVFVFLAIYLTIAIFHFGVARAVIFTVIAYTVAFLSEYSSTRTGFPYGTYHYIETTRENVIGFCIAGQENEDPAAETAAVNEKL